MRLHLFLPLLIVAASPCRAQNVSDIPPPKPPLVAAVPDRADWTITVRQEHPKPLANGAKPSPEIVAVHTTRTGDTRRTETVYSTGMRNTEFFVGSLDIWKDRAGIVGMNDRRQAEVSVSIEDPDPASPEGFPGVRWLQLAYFDKVVVVQTRPCYHFVHGEVEAWIDVETKLPVSYKSGHTEYVYKFGDVPADALVLPPEFRKVLDQYQQMKLRQRTLEHPLPISS